MNSITLEICVDSVESSIIAETSGAQRIELCTNLLEGGTTPSLALIEKTRQLLEIQVYVLIRPRGGDFLYNHLEFECMKWDIRHCGEIGCDGVVIGMLNADGTVDMEGCRELIEIARHYAMDVTFHRAIDRCIDPVQGLEDIIKLGCKRILTSGGKNTALEGIPVIKQLVEQAAGRISIMPGAGITPENSREIIKQTGVNEIHGTFRKLQHSTMWYKNTALSKQEQEYSVWLADEQKIKKMVELCR